MVIRLPGHVMHAYESSRVLENGDVEHYTCNAPSEEDMARYGITSVEGLGCGPRGVLIIPSDLFSQFGYPISEDQNVLTITAERLLTRL